MDKSFIVCDRDKIECKKHIERVELVIDDIPFVMSYKTAKYLHEQLEQFLYDEDSWNVNLDKKVVDLENQIEELQEEILLLEEN